MDDCLRVRLSLAVASRTAWLSRCQSVTLFGVLLRRAGWARAGMAETTYRVRMATMGLGPKRTSGTQRERVASSAEYPPMGLSIVKKSSIVLAFSPDPTCQLGILQIHLLGEFMPTQTATPSTSSDSPSAAPATSVAGLADGLGDPLAASPGLSDPLGSPDAPTDDPQAPAHSFDVDGERHTVWTREVDGQQVTYVASHPMPILTRLRKWDRAAKQTKDPVMQKHLLRLLAIAWEKMETVQTASKLTDADARAEAIARAQQPLAGAVGVLFRAFDVAYPGVGASAVYRGLHFSKDWRAKRGRSVEAEGQRTFEEVKSDGSYSAASYELAAALAKGGKVNARHLKAATEAVDAVLEVWKTTTNGNRQDTAGSHERKRKALESGVEKYRQTNPAESARLQGLRDDMDKGFTQGGHLYEDQFKAALSRYIDNQKLFEAEMRDKSDGGYKDLPFTAIPFISTTKVAAEGVKYAEGKLASDDQRSDTGIVGRVLVYVAPTTALVEAGGIDVWAGMKDGTLNFTTWRKAENEITFAGSIPDTFLQGMTEVDAAKDTATNAAAAEQEAAKRASPWGGLIPLPINED